MYYNIFKVCAAQRKRLWVKKVKNDMILFIYDIDETFYENKKCVILLHDNAISLCGKNWSTNR